MQAQHSLLSDERTPARARVPHNDGIERFKSASNSGQEGSDAHTYETKAGHSEPTDEVDGVTHIIKEAQHSRLLIRPVKGVPRRPVVEAKSE
jgi:hypothetical protein